MGITISMGLNSQKVNKYKCNFKKFFKVNIKKLCVSIITQNSEKH